MSPGGVAGVTPGEEERRMRRALEMARAAARRGEVPVGAVLVAADGSVYEDHNRTRELSDPTAHAEMLVLRAASAAQGDWRLVDSSLYVTLEPCAMCAGAVIRARVSRLVFGAADPRGGMCGSLENLVQDSRLNHTSELVGGVLADPSSRLLRSFFSERRQEDAGESVRGDGG